MLTPHPTTSPVLADPPAPPTAALTLASSLTISLELAGAGLAAQAFTDLRSLVLQQQDLPSPMSAAQRETARRSLNSTMVLVESGWVRDPHGLLTLDALDAALAQVLTPPTAVQA